MEGIAGANFNQIQDGVEDANIRNKIMEFRCCKMVALDLLEGLKLSV